MRPLPAWYTPEATSLSSGEAAMVMGGLITCIKRRKQKEIHSKKLYSYDY